MPGRRQNRITCRVLPLKLLLLAKPYFQLSLIFPGANTIKTACMDNRIPNSLRHRFCGVCPDNSRVCRNLPGGKCENRIAIIHSMRWVNRTGDTIMCHLRDFRRMCFAQSGIRGNYTNHSIFALIRWCFQAGAGFECIQCSP